MTNLNGGYVMLDLASTKVYEDAKAAVAAKKPILVYDNGKCYYADTFEVDGDDNVVITKGNTTITIETDGDVVKDEKHIYEYQFYCSYDNKNGDAQYLYVRILSNKNVDLDLNGLKELLDNYKVPVVGTINNPSDLSDDYITLPYTIMYNSTQNPNKFGIETINDETYIVEDTDFTNFEVRKTLDSYKNQLI